MKRPRIRVSDHAVLRYLQRVGGFDIERLRAEIAARVEGAAEAGASGVVIDGFRYCIRPDDFGHRRVVTTILDRELASDAHQVERGDRGGERA